MARTKRRTLRHKPTVVGGGGIISSVINKAVDLLPVELHLPGGYKYCGPGTKLKERLARGDKGINGLDEACKTHDIAYSRYKDSENRRKADLELAEHFWQRFKAPDASFGEKVAAWAVTTAMKVKAKLCSVRRRRRQSKRRPTRGKGFYLRPYKKEGSGRKRKRRATKKKISIPIKPLTNYELMKYAKLLNIPNFRGVYMRDTLPLRPRKYESAIINLDSATGQGTHWVCYKKSDRSVCYYDSFGNLKPPPELLRYFDGFTVHYNYEREQSFDSVVCGHLCLKFLCNDV